MIHVMHIIESLEFGGAEKVVVQLANTLSKDHKVSICLTKREGELLNDVNENIQVFSLACKEGNDFSLPGKIVKLATEHKVDILHSHDWGVFLESALAKKRAKRTKLIHTVHGPYIPYGRDLKSRFKIRLRHYLEKILSKQACKIIPVSDSIGRYISDDIGIPETKLMTIRNGIADNFKLTNKKNENDIVRFVAVGRLAKVKNYGQLLSALASVTKTTRDFHLSFVGEGPERKNLEKQVKNLNLQDNVTFMGFCTNVQDIIAQHDVFVMSSQYEGISIALLEAMSYAMPAISTNVGGIPETIEDNVTGYLAPLGDIDSYANKLLQFIQNKNLITEMGKKARQRFLQEFQESIVLDKYKATYAECLGIRK